MNLKLIKHLNLRPEIIKLLERKNRQYALNQWEHIKLKVFCIVKETSSKWKRKPTKCEKIYANDMYNKELYSKHTNIL